jgi:trans-aconitate methyltransferase
MDLKEEDILKEKIYSHWYYVSKGFALQKYVSFLKGKEILDVGAGSGIFSKQLLSSSTYEKSICVDISYKKEWEEKYNGKEILFRKNLDSSNADLVMMMDVLEHVPDDSALLSMYAEKVKSGTYFLITVPAFQFLFSTHDLFLEHYRRYTISQLKESVQKANLEIVKMNYFFGIIFPLIVMIRLMDKLKMKLLGKNFLPKSDLKIANPIANSILIGIHKVEEKVFSWNKIAGLSVFCLARKK